MFILGAISLFIAGAFFVHPAPEYEIISGLFVILLALPSFSALLRWIGPRKGFLILSIVTVIPFMVEALAVITGFPYGNFRYSTSLGMMLLGRVPFSVAFAYPPVLIGAVTLACRFSSNRPIRTVLLSNVFLLLADLVIDPAAVHAGFWIWGESGDYYGVPLSNFLGWAMTGTLYSAMLLSLFDHSGSGEYSPPS
ncbi:carotenoid biosynthesis protein, partial [Methanothrix sp.]|uniref:carotenoid biosynthesis protein n=1 Tax=Methanothrix sp. TaxID=90426 RepID=UPI0034E19E9F